MNQVHLMAEKTYGKQIIHWIYKPNEMFLLSDNPIFSLVPNLSWS